MFASFQKMATSRFKFGWFMLAKLPSAFICGVRVSALNPQEAIVSVPFTWLSQNPFNSTYFACLSMAAEMSTGLLALGHLHKRQSAVSMLVTKVNGTFVKKATERIYFTCADGDAILLAIETAVTTGEGQVVSVTSNGRTAAGDVVAIFTIEWSFKARVKK